MLKVFAENLPMEILPPVKTTLKVCGRRLKMRLKFWGLIRPRSFRRWLDFTKRFCAKSARNFLEKCRSNRENRCFCAKKCLVFGLRAIGFGGGKFFYLSNARSNAKREKFQLKGLLSFQKIKAPKERDCFLPVSVETNSEGKLIIKSLQFSGSSNFIAFSQANALVFVSQGRSLETGDVAEILFLWRNFLIRTKAAISKWLTFPKNRRPKGEPWLRQKFCFPPKRWKFLKTKLIRKEILWRLRGSPELWRQNGLPI